MIEFSFINVVKNSLMERWKNQNLNLEDHAYSIELFTHITVEHINKKYQFEIISENPDGVVKRIESFVKLYGFAFTKACKSGFPFSLLEKTSALNALKHSLQKQHSIFYNFMMKEHSYANEVELEANWKFLFQNVKGAILGNLCAELHETYLSGSYRSGLYLLWLIKKVGSCSFQIPHIDSFSEFTVLEVLSNFIKQEEPSIHCFQLLHYRARKTKEPLFKELLDMPSCEKFISKEIDSLCRHSAENWPKKWAIVIDLLENVSDKNKEHLAKGLQRSLDQQTVKIGHHLDAVLNAESFQEAYPHFSSLSEFLPLNADDFEKIFNYPHTEYIKINQNEPYLKKFLFHFDLHKIFIHRSLIIGVYYPETVFCNLKVVPYLIAFDVELQQMAWGFPLTPPPNFSKTMTSTGSINFHLTQVRNRIFLQFKEDNTLFLLNTKTGKLDSKFDIPEALSNWIHISLENDIFIVKQDEKMFLGGVIINEQWQKTFEIHKPEGLGRLYSTHFGFHNPINRRLTLFNTLGHSLTLENCISAEARDNKLYVIQKRGEKCLLSVRTLKQGSAVVSDIEVSIPLETSKVIFGELCKNRQWILFPNELKRDYPIFVDIHTKKVVYNNFKGYKSFTQWINKDTGEIWRSEQLVIWKITEASNSLETFITSMPGTLIYVDKKQNFYLL